MLIAHVRRWFRYREPRFSGLRLWPAATNKDRGQQQAKRQRPQQTAHERIERKEPAQDQCRPVVIRLARTR